MNKIKNIDTNKWFNCSDKLPLCYKTGCWDGKKSDLILGETITGKKFLGICYVGIMNGHSFVEWYQIDEINKTEKHFNEEVFKWFSIPL